MHTAVRQIRIQGRQPLAAVTDDAAEGFDRVRWADFGQVSVAGEAVFGLAAQGWGKGDWLQGARIHPPGEAKGKQENPGCHQKWKVESG